MPENFLPKVVTVFPLKAFKKLSFQFLIVHRNHPFCDLNIPPFLTKFNPQCYTKLKHLSYAERRNCISSIDICPREEYIINVGRPKKAVFFIFRQEKKRPFGANIYTNEMTLGLSHLSPTIKQGSFLFYFSI